MVTGDGGEDADAAAARTVLLRLAAKGAYAEPIGSGQAGAEGGYLLVSPRCDEGEAPARASGRAVAWACRRGWLVVDPASGRCRVGPAGVAVLRRARCGGASPAGRRTRARAPGAAPAAPAAPVRVVAEGSLAWLRSRKDRDGQPLISEAQHAAGERLAADFWQAGLSPRVTASWSGLTVSRVMRRAAPGAGIELADHVVAARQRVERALAAVGPELSGVVVDVCCLEMGLEAAGRVRGWPRRAAKVVLQLGLTRLGRHYGLIAPEPAPGFGRMRHWGAEDYRPGLDAWR